MGKPKPVCRVIAILGHKSLEMTRRYVKVLPRMGRSAADRMQEVVG